MHEENMAILKSLVSVAWADGTFADAEREMVDALISAFEASDDEAHQIRMYASSPRTIEDISLPDLSADDRRVLLQHAVFLSFVDGDQHATEKQFITDLSKHLHIPDDEAGELVKSSEERAKRFLNLL